MNKSIFDPYRNESDSIQIDKLTVENRIDRISIFGTIDLWKDKGGLEAALELKAILDQAVAVLQQSELPDKVELAKTEIVPNPFD